MNGRIRGLQTVIGRLRQSNAIYNQRLHNGIVRAAAVIFRASQQLVPIDTGFLRASGFVRVTGTGIKTVAAIGYTAAYAIYVHENLEALHGQAFNTAYAKQLRGARKLKRAGVLSANSPFRHNRGPRQQAKFLEHPFRTLRMPLLHAIDVYVRTGVWQNPSDTWWKS